VHAENWLLFYTVSRFASGGRAKRVSTDVRCASSDALTGEPPDRVSAKASSTAF
jgi:hypothetical protein